MTATNSRIAASKALQVLNIMRTLDQDMPIGQAVSFFLIAIGETEDGGGLSGTELEAKGGFSRASSSRYAKTLSDKDRHQKPGLMVVTYERDPKDDRRKIMRISKKGKLILEQVKNVLVE